MENSKKVFRIFTAVFLGLVLLTGLVLGIISIVRNIRAVMVYRGVYLYQGEANYLSATYKKDFMSTLARGGIECTDDEAFWSSDAGNGKTYGDLLAENTEKYLKSVLVGNYLFERNSKLTKEDKNAIAKSIDEVLAYRADGNKSRFDEIGATMGFDFRDFKRAAELLYKAEKAQEVIFGYEGAALESGNFTAECDEYFNNSYSRVSLLIIRTDGKFVVEENTGRSTFKEYTAAEREEAITDIENVRENIALGQMNFEGAFKWFIDKYPTEAVNDAYGYYFSSSSAYSRNFANEGARNVVQTALTMDIGSYAECELDIGTCFIYRHPLEERAYANTAISHFFGDFYKNASPYIYQKSVDELLTDVKVKKKYNPTAVISQKYNYELTISFN